MGQIDQHGQPRQLDQLGGGGRGRPPPYQGGQGRQGYGGQGGNTTVIYRDGGRRDSGPGFGTGMMAGGLLGDGMGFWRFGDGWRVWRRIWWRIWRSRRWRIFQ